MTDGLHHGPIFKAIDGSSWVWNRFRSELQELYEPPSDCVAQDPGARIGQENREAVRAFFTGHVGCTHVECGKALGLSSVAVGRHVATLRKEWSK